MDNIREKLKAVFEFCIDDPYCFPDVDEFIDKLAATGVTVQQWRSVSELPKRNGETVLVYFEYFRYGEYNRLFRSIGLGYALDGQWSRFINGESGWHKLKILAWMPLPVPPKQEG